MAKASWITTLGGTTEFNSRAAWTAMFVFLAEGTIHHRTIRQVRDCVMRRADPWQLWTQANKSRILRQALATPRFRYAVRVFLFRHSLCITDVEMQQFVHVPVSSAGGFQQLSQQQLHELCSNEASSNMDLSSDNSSKLVVFENCPFHRAVWTGRQPQGRVISCHVSRGLQQAFATYYRLC